MRARARDAARPRRILHVTQPVDAGVGAVVEGVARHQVAAGWEVYVACPKGGHLSDRMAAAGVNVADWPATRSLQSNLAREARQLHSILWATAPDVVHLHSSKAGLIGRLVIRGRLPTLFQPHAWSFLAVDGAVRSAAVMWERFSTRWTSLLILVSDAERREGVATGVDCTRSIVIPNGVDQRRFTERERLSARRRLGLPSHAPIALCVGRVCRQKGQETLVRHWSRVAASVPDAQLICVGDGPDLPRLLSEARADTHLVGASKEPEIWYAAANVVIVPSRWEGMALVPLEAMSCGRAVVAFDVPGVRESLNGNGAIVRGADVDGLLDALAERLLDPLQTDAEGARAAVRARREFSWDCCAEALTQAASSQAQLP